jgi:Golgi nucleoside diphosphatase
MIFLPEVSYGTIWQYGAILDAGSTSTKVKIYRWPPRTSLKSVLDIKQVGNSEKYSPGISNYVNDLGNISKYIEQMIERVKVIIPSNVHRTTSLYLLATAGKTSILIFIVILLVSDSILIGNLMCIYVIFRTSYV